MNNKKKVLIAVILFIFLGLTIFTFANPADEQIKEQGTGASEKDGKTEKQPKEDQKDNDNVVNVNGQVNEHGVNTNALTQNQTLNNNTTNDNTNKNEELGIGGAEEDDTYEKALEAVILAESKLESLSYESALELVNKVTNSEKQTELNNRLTNVKNAIDVRELVVTLSTKTNSASNKAEMDGARDYRTVEEIVNRVSSLTNETLKDELKATLEELSKLLDDTDLPEFDVKSGTHSTDTMTIKVEDLTLDYIEIYNQDKKTTEIVTESEITLTDEATYRVTAYDKNGNKSTVWVAIDKTKPTIKVEGTGKDNYFRKDVTVTVEDKFLTAVEVNGEKQEGIETTGTNNEGKTLVKVFTEEGAYTVVATDKAGNTETVTFTIDKTKPGISNVENGKYYNTDVTPMIEDANLKNATLKLDGNHIKSYKVGDTLTKEGTYTLVATDKAMNKTKTITFTIDKTKPVVTLYMKGKKVDAGKWYTSTLKAAIEEANEYTAILKDHNNKEVEYVSETDISGRANYTLTVTDVAGNQTVVEFGIDKDYPLIYLNGSKNEKVKENVQYFNGDVEVKITDLNLDSVVFTKDGEQKTFENNTTITEEGTYTILATDKAGNKTQVNFVIDKTAPIVSIDANKSIGSDGYYSKVVINVSDNSNLDYYLINGKFKSTITNLTSTHSRTFVGGHIIEGKNTIVVYDKAGNISEVIEFIADYTAPVASALTIVGGSGIWEDNVYTRYPAANENVYVYVTFNEKLAKKPTLKIGEKEYEMNIEHDNKDGSYKYYTKDVFAKDLEEGLVEFEVYGYQDKAGNEGEKLTNTDITLTSQSRVFVDKTAPEIEKIQVWNALNSESTYIKNGDRVRVLATFNEKLGELPTLTIGSKSELMQPIAGGSGEIIYSAYITIPDDESELKEGTLEFIISGYKDLSGNIGNDVTNTSTNKNLTYDRTAPSYNFVGIMNIDQKTEGYAKVGDRVWVYAVINEHLSQEPVITINGVKAKIVQTEDGAKFNADWYKYVGEVVMTEDMNEGEIQFTVNGYKDLAGNEGLELTNANINKGIESITLDKTAPVISIDKTVNLIYSENFVEDINDKISDNYTSNEDLKVEIYPVNGIEVNSYVAGKYQINYKITDKGGNYKVETRTINVLSEEETVKLINNQVNIALNSKYQTDIDRAKGYINRLADSDFKTESLNKLTDLEEELALQSLLKQSTQRVNNYLGSGYERDLVIANEWIEKLENYESTKSTEELQNDANQRAQDKILELKETIKTFEKNWKIAKDKKAIYLNSGYTNDYNNAKVAIEKLPEGLPKKYLLNDINNFKFKKEEASRLNDAKNQINAYEGSGYERDITLAQAKIDKLQDENNKKEMNAKLQETIERVNSAKEAVNTYKSDKTEENLKNAQEKVNLLLDGYLKTNLLNGLK